MPLFLDDSQNAIGIAGTDGRSPLTLNENTESSQHRIQELN